MSCVICFEKSDVHHLYSRKAFPEFKNASWNLINLCRKHHAEIHQRGIRTIANKYPQVKEWLLNNGWEFDDVLFRWFHERQA